jgi:hypothetical protein
MLDEGDPVLLGATVYRADNEQALIEFKSMEGWFSVRVPLDQLTKKETQPVRHLRQGHRANAIRITANALVPIFLLVVLVALLTGCDTSSTSDTTGYEPSAPGGFGMTYNGKPGIDMGSGLVLDPGKGTVSPGYGF